MREELFNAIYKFIDEEFVNDDLAWEYDINPDTEGYEKNIVNFYGEKYVEGYQNDWYFIYVKKEYYEHLRDFEDAEFSKKWIDKSPLLDFTDHEMQNKLNGLFNDLWKPVFEKWFSEHYPEFPVKTFIYKK